MSFPFAYFFSFFLFVYTISGDNLHNSEASLVNNSYYIRHLLSGGVGKKYSYLLLCMASNTFISET